MSIFSSIDSQANVSVIEGYGADVSGAVTAVTESFADQLGIIKAIHAMDAGQYESTMEAAQHEVGSAAHTAVIEQYAAVYEASVSNVFDKIKAFFQKLWTKVKSFFHAVRRRFDLIFKDTESFVKKYETELTKLKLSGFKAETYNYTIDEGTRVQAVADAVDNILAKNINVVRTGELTKEKVEAARTELDKAIDDIKSEARSKISGAGKADMNESEYSQALFSLFRNGAKGPEDKEEKDVNINNIIAEAKGTTKLLKVIDKAKEASDKRYKGLVEASDKAGKEAKKRTANVGLSTTKVDNVGYVRSDAIDGAVALLQKMSTVTGLIQGIESKYYNAWKVAVEERNRDYKSIIGKALRYKEKN